MTSRLNRIIQGLEFLVHMANIAGGVVPTKYQLYVAAIARVGGAIAAEMASFANPDGTPAEHPWLPDTPRPQVPPR